MILHEKNLTNIKIIKLALLLRTYFLPSIYT